MNKFMKESYKEALKAYKKDEVPVGCVVVKDGKIIARAHNLKEKKKNPLSHAEIECINKACKKLDDWYLKDCELYVTLEPCVMCASVIINCRISKVYFGARDSKAGALGGMFNLLEQEGFNHYFDFEYLNEDECGQILKDFFKEKRIKKDALMVN